MFSSDGAAVLNSGHRAGRGPREGRVDPSEVASLVRRAATGDEPAWSALVEAFTGMVWAVASEFRLGHADTAEVVQVTWLRLVEHLDAIHQPEAVGGWLATTARREALRVLRMRAREELTGDEPPVQRDVLREPVPDPADRAVAGERKRQLWRAYRRLPDNCRTLLHLLSVVVLPYAEVSSLLGMPVGSIGPTRARCLDRLRRLLAEDAAGLPR